MRTLALRRCARVLRRRPRHGNVLRLRGQAGRHRRGGTGRDGSDPPVQGPGTGSGPGVFAHLAPPSWGRSRAIDPSRKGVGPMRPAALAIIGTALGAAAGHAFRAPFPGIGGNPVLDLIAYHDPGLPHRDPRLVLRGPGRRRRPCRERVPLGLEGVASAACKTPRPGQAARLARLARGRCRALARRSASCTIPTVPRESERPSWLVIPETGLYTGVLVVGAVGTGKTTACMYPFAQQLLSWQADRAGRRASALGARGQGRLLLQRAPHPRRRRARR